MKRRILAALIAATTLLSACAYDLEELLHRAVSTASNAQEEKSEQEESESRESEGDDGTASNTDGYIRGINTDTGWESEYWNL